MVLLEFLDNFAVPVATGQVLRSSPLRTCGRPSIEYKCRHYLIRKSQDFSSHIFRALLLGFFSGTFGGRPCSSRSNFGGVHKLA